MIRAFQHKLEQVEQEIREQDEQLRRLNDRLEEFNSTDFLSAADDETEGEDGAKSTASPASPALTFALNKISSTVKETKFSVNDLTNKVNRHDNEIKELRLVLAENISVQNAASKPRVIPGGCNPNASEFRPRTSPRGPVLPGPTALREVGASMPHLAFLVSEGSGICSSNHASPRSEDGLLITSTETNIKGGMLSSKEGATLDSESYSGDWDKSPRDPSDADPAALIAEIIYLRRKVEHLETQVHRKEESTRELIMCKDQISTKEKEYLSRQEWYEHKMRLLKQDKRRRGETIGKLLRCIDDMRDNGKLEPERVTDGKLVLESTLETRGWPQEQRIKAAVQAMEVERTEQRNQAAAEAAAQIASELGYDVDSVEAQDEHDLKPIPSLPSAATDPRQPPSPVMTIPPPQQPGAGAIKLPTSTAVAVNYKPPTAQPVTTTSTTPSYSCHSQPVSVHPTRQGISRYSNPQMGSVNPAASLWPPPAGLPAPRMSQPHEGMAAHHQQQPPRSAAVGAEKATAYSRVVVGRSFAPGGAVEQAFSQKPNVSEKPSSCESKFEGKPK